VQAGPDPIKKMAQPCKAAALTPENAGDQGLGLIQGRRRGAVTGHDYLGTRQ